VVIDDRDDAMKTLKALERLSPSVSRYPNEKVLALFMVSVVKLLGYLLRRVE
jgi:hypothetical protein